MIDPATGETYNVKPVRAAVKAAHKLGYFPIEDDGDDRVFEILFPAERA
jgi:hypothetical protein